MTTHSKVGATIAAPTTIAQVQDAIRSVPRLLVHGSQTKPALATSVEASPLDLRGLNGILEYDPGEYTFTALAGTPLTDLVDALAAHGQALPFDPPLVAAGATLGGTIAAGLSGSGRYRYGGLRDFIVGVRVVDGTGRLVRGGGKVVKNAAGFDLPKLMVGSAGRLAVIVEASFKVFPAPQTWSGVRAVYASLTDALAALQRLRAEPGDLEILDLIRDAHGTITVIALIAGIAGALPGRTAALQKRLGAGELLDATECAAYRHSMTEFQWATGDRTLVKLATTLTGLAQLDAGLAELGATRRYTVGGNLAWVALPGHLAPLDALLRQQQISGVVLRASTSESDPADPFIGRSIASPFLARVRQALDPTRRFPDLPGCGPSE